MGVPPEQLDAVELCLYENGVYNLKPSKRRELATALVGEGWTPASIDRLIQKRGGKAAEVAVILSDAHSRRLARRSLRGSNQAATRPSHYFEPETVDDYRYMARCLRRDQKSDAFIAQELGLSENQVSELLNNNKCTPASTSSVASSATSNSSIPSPARRSPR